MTVKLNSAELRAKAAMAAKLYAATKPTNLVAPITHTNGTTEGKYTGNNMSSPRADADNNLLHASLGLSAQISVRAA